jgi:hypothetical protein
MGEVPLRHYRTAIVLSLAVGGLAVFAAMSLGGSSSHGLIQTRDFGTRAASPASGPNKAGAARLNYFQTTHTFTVNAQDEDAFAIKCPKGQKAINGYFATSASGAVLDHSAVDPNNTRKWDFALLNVNTSGSVDYYAGIVCAKNL